MIEIVFLVFIFGCAISFGLWKKDVYAILFMLFSIGLLLLGFILSLG